MASGKIKDPFSGSGSSAGRITSGLPGLTTTDTATQDILAQTTQSLVADISNVGSGLSTLTALQQQQAAALEANTAAVDQNTQNRSGGIAGTIESAASGLLQGGGLLSPLISGIASLFGGSSSSTPPALQAFTLPPPIAIQGTVSASAGAAQSAAPAMGTATSNAITVQVSAMDSKSFIDHQDDIANAVREAVLHSHALNDVLRQL